MTQSLRAFVEEALNLDTSELALGISLAPFNMEMSMYLLAAGEDHHNWREYEEVFVEVPVEGGTKLIHWSNGQGIVAIEFYGDDDE